MAPGDEGASSSNSSFNSAPRWKYHVFLSFRGKDTRNTFADFLYAALVRKGILTFRDEEQLEGGQVISDKLTKAIEESLSAIVVLSPKYATSAWCLDELQIIVESKKMTEELVFPIFYDVEPSDVRYQIRTFAEAFKKHEERYDKVKVEGWRQALSKIAGLSGYPSKDRHQTQLIEEVVADLWTKVQRKLPIHDDGLVGIHLRKEKVLSLLGKDVCFIGIWGMGGIGKTTLAIFVYETIRNDFEISCLLERVRETSGENGHGLVKLQRKLLSCLKISGMEIEDSLDGKNKIRDLLYNKKVLLVLDDISANDQLENLAGNKKWFGPGSRVIITTRDQHLLTLYDAYEMYPMQFLNSEESTELLCQKAFKDQPEPEQRYLELSKEVVQYAGGLPLVLEVLGPLLRRRSIPEWEKTLDKIKRFPPTHIMSKLCISYEALDDQEKDIFRNIACFFKGMSRREVTHILEMCDLYPTIGINVLFERSLLTEYLEDGKWRLGMHDLLQEMGKQIVIQESVDDVEKRSRLWLQEDIDDVLTQNKGTKLIQSIVLNPSRPYAARWDPEAFSKMQKIKLLMFDKLDLPLGLSCLSKGLKFLKWKQFPLEELPLGVQLDNLVELTMRESKIKQPWQGTKHFGKLKIIDLTDSTDLILFPSVAGLPCLDSLVLIRCINLIEVHPSVGVHKKLRLLNLRGCMNLEILPKKLEMDSLEIFILANCSKVKELPEFGDNMENLVKLILNGCKSLVFLPRSIDNLKSLRILDTSDCPELSSLPENLDKFEGLEELDVRGTAIKDVPPTIVHLKYLKKLFLGGQREPESNLSNPLDLPFTLITMLPSLSTFSFLNDLDLSYRNLSDELLPGDLGGPPLLWTLNLSGNYFINLPSSFFASLSQLYVLRLDNCPMLKSVPTMPSEVDRIYARNTPSWKPFSDPKFLNYYFSTHQKVKSDYYHFLVIQGSEIPPWFSNQDYFHEEIDSSFRWEVIMGKDTVYDPSTCFDGGELISIIVDIPDHCVSSGGWGIALCLVFENPFIPSPWLVPTITYICRTPKIEMPIPSGFPVTAGIEEFSDPHLCMLMLGGDDPNIQRHLRGGHNQIQLLFYVLAASLSSSVLDLVKISKCGCRVLSKKDLQMWGNARSKGKQIDNLDNPSRGLNNTRESDVPSSSLNEPITQIDIGDENPCCDGSEITFVKVENAEAKR